MAAIATTQTERVAFKKIPQAALTAGIIAAVINVIIWFIGNAIGGMKIPVALAAINSVVGIVIGGGIYALLGRFTKRPITIFTIVCVVFLVIYALLPINAMRNAPMPGMEPFNTITMIGTELMHLVAGGLAIWFYTKKARA